MRKTMWVVMGRSGEFCTYELLGVGRKPYCVRKLKEWKALPGTFPLYIGKLTRTR